MKKNEFSPIIISGPSGSGKTEFINYVEKKDKRFLEASGMTTRDPRPNEIGKMSFISIEQFQKKIESGNLIEYTLYKGNYYGVEKSELEKTDKFNMIFNVSYSSAKVIKDLREDSKLIYFLPPTKEELLFRLGDRGKERFELGIKETINNARYYEYLLLSYTCDFEKIYQNFIEIVEEKESSKQKRMIELHNTDFVNNFYK